MLRTTWSAENFSSLMVEDAEVGSIGGGGNCKDKTVEKSLLIFKNLNRATSYLYPNVKEAFI